MVMLPGNAGWWGMPGAVFNAGAYDFIGDVTAINEQIKRLVA
jgi:chemotaxis response regulator CheB